jgi:hypothetical protein
LITEEGDEDLAAAVVAACTLLRSGAGNSDEHDTLISASGLAVGAILSSTVIFCTQSEKLPQASVARYAHDDCRARFAVRHIPTRHRRHAAVVTRLIRFLFAAGIPRYTTP